MARTSIAIPPFPDDIDRRAFGAWLSGFTDGEGCFDLSLTTSSKERGWLCPLARFTIKLRADDSTILGSIRSYWQCGSIYYGRRRAPDSTRRSKPTFLYQVRRCSDLANIIVPHFSEFPLYAKKKRDFAIWKEAVELMAVVTERPRRRIALKSGRLNGTLPRWTEAEKKQFEILSERLHRIKEYDANAGFTQPST